jgi:hypothetical protein
MSDREPNWDKISEISQRAEASQDAGTLDYPAWRALFAEAETASNGLPDFTEFMFRFAGEGWIDRLFAEPKPKRTRKPRRAA